MSRDALEGLTTTKSSFIENSVNNNELFIHQPYELYSTKNQEAWKQLWDLIWPKWKQFANKRFLKGIELLGLSGNSIPRLEEINDFLFPLTGFQAKAVSGYVPAHLFFDCLENRNFPTTVTIRDLSSLDYLPEPDIFHDIAGHVPMHTDREFADILAKLGSLARDAAIRSASFKNHEERHQVMLSNIRALARFFWFTIEFGLIKEKGRICAYGSGLLSSPEEIEHSVTSPSVERLPFKLDRVINQPFEIDSLQPLLFVVDSFEHLFDQVKLLEKELHEGKLDDVALGKPEITHEEIQSFLESICECLN